MSEATVKPEYVKEALVFITGFDPTSLMIETYLKQVNGEIPMASGAFSFGQVKKLAARLQSHASELERVRKKLSFMEVTLEEIQRKAQHGVDMPNATWPCEEIVGLCKEGLRSLLNTPETNP